MADFQHIYAHQAREAEAESLTRFFFGDELADRVVKENLVLLPECTDVWWWQRIL